MGKKNYPRRNLPTHILLTLENITNKSVVIVEWKNTSINLRHEDAFVSMYYVVPLALRVIEGWSKGSSLQYVNYKRRQLFKRPNGCASIDILIDIIQRLIHNSGTLM